MQCNKKNSLVRKERATTVSISMMILILAAGCTDPSQPPTLAIISPNPAVPLSTEQDLHFYGANQDQDVYYIMDTGTEQLTLGPDSAPGEWKFRCIFGFHFIYTFNSLESFLSGLGSPAEIEITAYNVGENLVNEDGGGDDLPSEPVTWVLEYQ